ncbi:Uncharacterised protein [Phocoenobacter uteri]|uniref:Transposase and inactivated derivatives n=1 Tax=Phocoenobacter uteri TaxID=146806 RepID=A0A379DGK7_9PAST|nr:Uncharacterised protein [Phocoenobacter uteri]
MNNLRKNHRTSVYTGRKEFEWCLDYIVQELSNGKQKLQVFNALRDSGKITFKYKNFLRLSNSPKYPQLDKFKRKNKKQGVSELNNY